MKQWIRSIVSFINRSVNWRDVLAELLPESVARHDERCGALLPFHVTTPPTLQKISSPEYFNTCSDQTISWLEVYQHNWKRVSYLLLMSVLGSYSMFGRRHVQRLQEEQSITFEKRPVSSVEPPPKFRRLVLGCIDAEFCNPRLIRKVSSSFTKIY